MVRILDYRVRSAFWWPRNWSHSHLTLGIITLSLADKIAPWTCFSTAATTLSTSLLTLPAIFFLNYLIMTCTSFTECWTLKIVNKTIVLRSYFFVPIYIISGIKQKKTKSFEDSFTWLRSRMYWCLFLRVETICVTTTELSKTMILPAQQQLKY